MDLFRLEDRTVLLTGALGGLAQALVPALFDSGADVVCVDQTVAPPPDLLRPYEAAAQRNGRVLKYFSCDVRDAETAASILAEVDRTCRNPLRGLVTCAGLSERHDAVDYPISDFKNVFDVNVTGTFIFAREAAKIMRGRGVAGSIVLLASMSATNVNLGVATCAYNSSKAALLQLARSLASEWGNDPDHPPIRVNALSPGYIRTAATGPTLDAMPHLEELWSKGNMLGRLSYAHEYRAPVIFLLGEGSSFMTASELRIDGGHCSW